MYDASIKYPDTEQDALNGWTTTSSNSQANPNPLKPNVDTEIVPIQYAFSFSGCFSNMERRLWPQ